MERRGRVSIHEEVINSKSHSLVLKTSLVKRRPVIGNVIPILGILFLFRHTRSHLDHLNDLVRNLKTL